MLCKLFQYLWCTWYKKWLPAFHCKFANIERMETIDIFLDADLTQYLLFVNMLRQWKLHKDA